MSIGNARLQIGHTNGRAFGKLIARHEVDGQMNFDAVRFRLRDQIIDNFRAL